MGVPTFVFLLTIPSFLAFLTLAYGLNVKRVQKKPYDFLSYFPYELYEDSRGLYLASRGLQGLYLLSTLALPAVLLSVYRDYQSTAISYLIGIAIVSFLVGLVELLLTIVTPRNPKDHLLLFYSLGALLSILSAMLGSFLYSLNKAFGNSKPTLLVFAAFLFLIALFSFLILLNPALKNWDRMAADAQEDGTVVYKRPRPFLLALSEWGLILLHFLALVLATVGYFLV